MASLPVLLSLAGAFLLWTLRTRASRVHWGASVLLAGLQWIVILALASGLPATMRVSLWRPASLFGDGLILQLGSGAWQLVYLTATLLLSLTLTAATRPQSTTAATRTLTFLYVGLGVIAILPGNLLTVVVAWALLDLATVLLPLAFPGPEALLERSFRRLGVDAAGLFLVLLAASLDREGTLAGSGARTDLATVLLSFGILLRLGLFPLHFSLPPMPGIRRGLGTPLRLLPPVAALAVLGQQLEGLIAPGLVPWIQIAGAAGLLVGGARFALMANSLEARPFLILGVSGLSVLAAASSPMLAGETLLAGASLLLILGAIVSLGEIYAPWHRAVPWLSGLLFLGLPWTPSWPLAVALMDGLAQPTGFLVAGIGAIGWSLLMVGILRQAYRPQLTWPEDLELVRLTYSLGYSLPLWVGLGIGVWGGGDPAPRSFLSAVVVAIIAMAILQFGRGLRWLLPFQASLRRLDPSGIYRVGWQALQAFLRVVRLVSAIIEGEAALLWLLVFLLLMGIGLGQGTP